MPFHLLFFVCTVVMIADMIAGAGGNRSFGQSYNTITERVN